MTNDEFNSQLVRLNETFKNYYSKSKAKIISNIVGEMPGYYFEKCVDKILWADRPPKIEWFQELIAAYRRRNAKTLDQIQRQENSIFTESDIKQMVAFMKARMDGRVSDEDYMNFHNTIKSLVQTRNDIKCKFCLDQGAYAHFVGTKGEMKDCSCKEAS
jgi:hypothetical protein